MEINRTGPGIHYLFGPACRLEYRLNTTFIPFGEVFSIFFMQPWGKHGKNDRPRLEDKTVICLKTEKTYGKGGII